MDASFVEVPHQRNKKEENEKIKTGEGEQLWNNISVYFAVILKFFQKVLMDFCFLKKSKCQKIIFRSPNINKKQIINKK